MSAWDDFYNGLMDFPPCYGECSCPPRCFVNCPYAEDCLTEKED